MPRIKIILFLIFGAFASATQAQTNKILPTVTISMEHAGGKIFGHPPEPTRTRHYYIAAERQLWDFAPLGQDVVCGMTLPARTAANRASVKIRYVEYTDATFTIRAAENPSLGILGPVMRGVVGDYLAVTFLNRADIPLSMHPHGVKYDKDSEGSYYQPRPGLGAAISPGARFTYVWQLDESSGPLPDEPSSKAWLYHSHVSGDEEVNLGLVGFIIVTDPKRARADGTPVDVDRELASLFMIFNESGVTEETEEEAEERARASHGVVVAKTWSQLQEAKEEGERYAINGRIFGNLTGLEMNSGERVRWYLFGLGSENDLHSAHWHGLRAIESRRRTDVVELLPASMKVADMVADNPGSWLFHCHVSEHMMGGMFARVIVHPADGSSTHRAPKTAFFGLPTEKQTLRISRAEAIIGPESAGAPTCEITLEGEVVVPQVFSPFENPVKVQLGGKSITFQPERDGHAEIAGGKFRVENASKNSSEYGIVYGGLMKFTFELSGNEWRKELVRAGFDGPSQVKELPVSLMLEITGVKYSTTISVITAPSK